MKQRVFYREIKKEIGVFVTLFRLADRNLNKSRVITRCMILKPAHGVTFQRPIYVFREKCVN